MYFNNGFFSSIGGFFKKVVSAPFKLVKKGVGFAGGLAGGLFKQLGIQKINLPFGLGGLELQPSEVGYVEPTGQVGVELTGISKIQSYLPFIIIGIVGIGLLFFLKK